MSNSNFKHVFGSVYVTKNQNGFAQALYHCIGCYELETNFYTKKELREAVVDYPTSYPCTIEINSLMSECSRINISILTAKFPCHYEPINSSIRKLPLEGWAVAFSLGILAGLALSGFFN